MNINKIKLTIIGICGLVLVPAVSNAAEATLITDRTALFTIDFSFTDEVFDLQVPIAADAEVTYSDRVNTLGYTIEDESGITPDFSDINALVLSTEPIVENRYALEQGETGTFTLLILATFADPVDGSYQASITKLPYWLDDRRTTVHQNQLDALLRATLEVE